MLVKQSSSFSRQYRIYLSTVQICVHQTVRLTTQFVGHKFVVNQTGYLGPLYASRHHTSLLRRQHIYSVQLLQTAQSASPSIAIVRSFVNTALLMPQITPHNPRLQVAHTLQ